MNQVIQKKGHKYISLILKDILYLQYIYIEVK